MGVKSMTGFKKTMLHSKFAITASVLILSAFVYLTPAGAVPSAEPEKQDWSFSGIFGTFDRGSLQRGFQVYKQVCAACHSLNLMSYRNLSQPGGPEFSEEQVKALAAEADVQDGPNDEGDMFDRPGRPSDKFVAPFPNEESARAANGGALPPDLSMMSKARRDGSNYLYSLLTGYDEEPPAGVEVRDGMNYNPYFTGSQIAMAPPLLEDAVEYTDGTKASPENMAKDVVTFLTWAAEPKMEERKSLGFKVLIYLIILAGLLYLTTRKIWSRIKH